MAAAGESHRGRCQAVVATEANTMELMQIEPWPHYARRLRRSGALAGRLSLLRETVAPSRFRLAYEVARKNPLRDDKVENFYSSVDGHGLKRTTRASCARAALLF